MKKTITFDRGLSVPHLDQYFGLWAVEPVRFNAMTERLGAMDLAAHVAEGSPLVAGPVIEGGIEAETDWEGGYTIINGDIALLDVRGVMTKSGSSLSPYGSTVIARRRLANALRNDKVVSIVLRIDSPGGSVAGTDDLANDVRHSPKPITAYIEDLGASAAYWIASQAHRVVANRTAQIGSIGVFMVVDDYSKNFEKRGIRTHVIRAGEFKGAGWRGTEITEAQRENWQQSVDEVYMQFIGAIEDGRGLSHQAAVALGDGRLHGPEEAKKLGLVDAIGTLTEILPQAKDAKETRIFRGTKSRAHGSADEALLRAGQRLMTAHEAQEEPANPSQAQQGNLDDALLRAGERLRNGLS